MLDTPDNCKFTYEKSSYPHTSSTAVIHFHDHPQPLPHSDPHIDRFYLLAPLFRGKHTLDVGCGFGYGSKIIASQASSVLGIDIDDHELEWASKWHQAPNLSFLHCPLENLQPHDFQAALCSEVIEHLAPSYAPDFLSALANHLAQNALAVFTTPCQTFTQKTSNHFHQLEYSHQDLLNLLSPLFNPTCAFWYNWLNSALYAKHMSTGIKGMQSPFVQVVVCEKR